MADPPKKPETITKRNRRLFKAVAKMLAKVCTREYGPGSYLGKHGEIIKAELRGSIIQITIDTWDDPPKRHHLNLKLASMNEEE